MYAFMFIWNQASRSAMQPAAMKFYVHHAVLKCEKGTDVTVKRTWHADQTIPLVEPLRCRLEFGLQNFKKLNPDSHIFQK